MMRVVIIGARGQLGQELCELYGSNAVGVDLPEFDLRDSAQVERTLSELRPEVVINTAAYNFVDRAEDEPAEAFATNAIAVRSLAIACDRLGCLLVHFSTDYVFGLDEDRRVPYEEGCAPGPVSVYGLSKLAGEYVARAYCRRHFVIRTCGLYGLKGSGGKGRNFPGTMLRLASERDVLRVVDDQVCTPSYVPDLAVATRTIVEQHIDNPRAYGLYHWTNAGECSWYEFACELFRLAGVEVRVEPITTEQFGAKARRPRYSVLSTASFKSLTGLQPRPWQEALQEYVQRTREIEGGR
jgi:dTDP-4-dehydrorhamnose reductase